MLELKGNAPSEVVDMIQDEKWPIARLIPISSASGVEAQERRLASALLAVMHAVPEFGRALLGPVGAPAGRIETFIEVPFKLGDKTLRADGVVTVTRGTKTWQALLEAKTATHPLLPEQIDAYLDLARELEFDAVLSVSNQYVTSSSDYPVEVDRRKLRRLKLHHWSWLGVLTEAIVQKEHRGVTDPDQAYILGELTRYLSDSRSGAVAFDGMGPSWTAVRDGARDQTLRKSDPAVAAVAARWDDLLRYLGLSLTADLGRQVKQNLPKSEETPAARREALVDSLVSRGRLYGELQVPHVAGPLVVEADLRARQIVVSTAIEAPGEGTSRGRVSWLLRQLQAAPENLKLEAKVTYSSTPLVASLRDVRENPTLVYPGVRKEIRSFAISLSQNMGLKRSDGRGSFMESVMAATEAFYADVLQNLRAWKPSPPKLKRQPEEPEAKLETVADVLDVEPSDLAPDDFGADEPEVGPPATESSALEKHGGEGDAV